MANYDELKKKAKETLDTIADASVDAYKVAEEKARILARKTKLRAGIVNEKATIRRLSVELGNSYYNLHKDDPAPEFEDLCEDISGAYERIALKEKEIEELKSNTGADSAEQAPDCCAPEAAQECGCEAAPAAAPEPEPEQVCEIAPEPEQVCEVAPEGECDCGCEDAQAPAPEQVCEVTPEGECDCGCETENPQE